MLVDNWIFDLSRFLFNRVAAWEVANNNKMICPESMYIHSTVHEIRANHIVVVCNLTFLDKWGWLYALWFIAEWFEMLIWKQVFVILMRSIGNARNGSGIIHWNHMRCLDKWTNEIVLESDRHFNFKDSPMIQQLLFIIRWDNIQKQTEYIKERYQTIPSLFPWPVKISIFVTKYPFRMLKR